MPEEPDIKFFPAPQCPNGKHELEECNNPWYRRCVHCEERFALLSETVINQIGIKIYPRSITEH